MKKKLLIIDTAALAHPCKVKGLEFRPVDSVLPALTCTVQASFRTASYPRDHGMVANGIFLRSLMKPLFWEQSARLVQGRRIWEDFRKAGKKVAMLFWQQSLGEDVDILLSPGPVHKHHGGMIQAFFSKPEHLYGRLCEGLGSPFRLQHYWGPLASWKAGDWITKAAVLVLKEADLAPDLCLLYLPTLDYSFQREDPEKGPAFSKAMKKVESQLSVLVDCAAAEGYEVLIFGDYHIGRVKEAIYPNRLLLNEGWMKTRVVKGMLYPDLYESRAFAMADHEAAHVYVPREKDAPAVKELLASLPGCEKVLDREAQMSAGLHHPNNGEILLVAGEGCWFAYPWWKEKQKAPEFSGHVDIHNKPGYDPCELFWGWPPGTVSRNTARIKGSHGKVGKGREVLWASTLSFRQAPADIVDLARSVELWLTAL